MMVNVLVEKRKAGLELAILFEFVEVVNDFFILNVNLNYIKKK